MSKTMASRLADSLRQVRENHPPPVVANDARTPALRTGRFARQSDQAPTPTSLDHPWDNLHPERIWPD